MEQLTARARAVRLLEQAVAYNLASVAEVRPAALRRPTPCAAWDLEHLLLHLRESMAALREAADLGSVTLLPREERPDSSPGGGLAGVVREDAEALLDGWRRWAQQPGAPYACVRVAGMPLPGDTAAFVGALELAVHGWDIAQACGRPRPIPAPLALAVLRRAPLVADPSTRPVLFAPPLAVPPQACPSDRLVAYLGRAPCGPGPG
jgi:uncharacterized protein (TIGR03086 family)